MPPTREEVLQAARDLDDRFSFDVTNRAAFLLRELAPPAPLIDWKPGDLLRDADGGAYEVAGVIGPLVYLSRLRVASLPDSGGYHTTRTFPELSRAVRLQLTEVPNASAS